VNLLLSLSVPGCCISSLQFDGAIGCAVKAQPDDANL